MQMEGSDDGSDLDDDYLDFQSHQLWSTATEGCFVSGSMSELPFQYYLANITDMDQMFFEFGCCAISADDPLPANFNKTVYTIDCNTCHPGFTRLRHGMDYVRKSEFMFNQWPINGPANKGKIIAGGRSAPPIQTCLGFKVKMSTDIVNCVFCPYWPARADQWVTRPRRNGWPPAGVIEDIVKGGCHVVPKSHPSCPNDDTVFRFSFSRAETVLIHSWSAEQKYVYHIIRLLKKDLHDECSRDGYKSIVCTYYLKTLLFWACEEQPATFWHEENLEESIGELICQLIQLLIDKRCPNYFIPENNMLGHIPESDDFDKDIAILLRIRQHAIRKRIAEVRMVTPNSSITGKTSNRLLLLIHLALSAYRCIVHPIKFLWSQRLEQSKPRRCRIAALEFGNLYRGIAGQLRLTSGNTEDRSDQSTVMGELKVRLETENYLSLAFTEDASGESTLTLRTDDTILDFIDTGLFEQISRLPDTKQDRLIQNNADTATILRPNQDPQLRNVDAQEQNYLVGNFGSKKKHTQLIGERNSLQKITDDQQSAANTISYVLLCASQQLHLKASYFASAAYLANFYYTFRHNYDRALDTCATALDNISGLFGIIGRETFYMNLCAVVLTSRWMPIFDARIQTVFGFATLFSRVHWKQINSTKRRTIFSNGTIPPGVVSYAFSNDCSHPPPVIIRLIPIHFIQYITVQCTRQFKQSKEKENDGKILLSELCSIFYENPRSCILYAALRISCSDKNLSMFT